MSSFVGGVYTIEMENEEIVAGIYASYGDNMFLITDSGDRRVIRVRDVKCFKPAEVKNSKLKVLKDCTSKCVAQHWAEKLDGKNAEKMRIIKGKCAESVSELKGIVG